MPTGTLSPSRLLVVLLVALIVLGPRRLRGAARALGQTLRELFKGLITSTDSQRAAEIVQARAPVTIGRPL